MKKQKKLTVAQRALQDEWERMLKRHARPLERGAKAKGQKTTKTEPSSFSLPERHVPCSLSDAEYRAKFVGSTPAQTPKTYTGDLMLGVAVMHKSNSVPVFNTDAAAEISSMRR